MSDELEDKESKTEAPSPRKLEKAIEEGNIPHSKEVNNFLMMCVLTLSITWILPIAFQYLLSDMRNLIANLYHINDTISVLRILLWKTIIYLSPLFIILVLVALLGNFIQHGQIIFSTKP